MFDWGDWNKLLPTFLLSAAAVGLLTGTVRAFWVLGQADRPRERIAAIKTALETLKLIDDEESDAYRAVSAALASEVSGLRTALHIFDDYFVAVAYWTWPINLAGLIAFAGLFVSYYVSPSGATPWFAFCVWTIAVLAGVHLLLGAARLVFLAVRAIRSRFFEYDPDESGSEGP
ncbi:hypothetical protein [Curtobacterium sp. MCBD17_040]|uniref:hypothetical protein n=1 Tax=Curtobacterium sp. MCBD17_040 TaxID=2175674 RepID=UPI000DA8A652|nr:hypothetical protein [Curtobacterium sp. MCBD17_040]WIB65477.1 hypothetical protein DEI94_19075 [Curtobacterium sp. MCBD17_040]